MEGEVKKVKGKQKWVSQISFGAVIHLTPLFPQKGTNETLPCE
jgi:hypothetical protein